MVGRSDGVRPGANASNLSVGVEASKVIKNGLKSAVVTEIGRIKVSENGNLRSLLLTLFHRLSFRRALEVVNYKAAGSASGAPKRRCAWLRSRRSWGMYLKLWPA